MDKYIHMFKCSEGSLAVDVPSDINKVEKELERRDNNNE